MTHPPILSEFAQKRCPQCLTREVFEVANGVYPCRLCGFTSGSAQPKTTAIANINEAERRLSIANDIHEMIELRDAAAAYELMANARGFKEAAQNAKIFQLKAERKAGAWLAENVKPGNPQLFQDGINSQLPEGIDAHESHRWQIEASLPEERFNSWIDESLANGWEISAGGLRRIASNYAGKHDDDPRGRKVAAFVKLAVELRKGATDAEAALLDAVIEEFS